MKDNYATTCTCKAGELGRACWSAKSTWESYAYDESPPSYEFGKLDSEYPPFVPLA